jgi:hypothetical protein
MKAHSLTLVAVALLGLTAITFAESPEPTFRLGVKLSDGSYIIGVPDDVSLPVRTSFASLDVPLHLVKVGRFKSDRETLCIEFRNGDKLTVVPDVKQLSVTTTVGRVVIGTQHITEFSTLDGITPKRRTEGPSKNGLISFGGLEWHPWRTEFAVVDGKLASQPRARKGFRYGHSGNGRGPKLVTHVGDKTWTDYSVDFDFAMLPKNPKFDPHRMPNVRGIGIQFRVQDSKESWNEPAQTAYGLSLGETGTWSLSRVHGRYITGGTGWRNAYKGTAIKLASGKGLTLAKGGSNHCHLEVVKNRIKISINDTQIVDLTDDEAADASGHGPLRYGGIGMSWKWESMGWIKNVVVRHGDARHGDTQHGPRLALDLVDGSHIIGIPSSTSVPVHTPYGKMDIPLNLIRRIKIGDDHETVSVYPINGDKITGVWGLKRIRLKTILGEIAVGTEHIKNITISGTGRLPVTAKERFPVVASAKITDKPYGVFCVADFNDDGELDFAVSNRTKGSESVDVYMNDGEGSLIKKASYPMGYYPQHVAAGDFNEDGHVDLLVPVYHGSLGDGTMHVLTGKGDGTFTMGPGFTAKVNGKGLHPCRLAVADLNKDGHLDFVVEMNNDWAINIHWGKGDGTFTAKYTYPNGQNPGNTKIADLNHDGWPDIVSGSQYTSLFVHLSDGNGGYTAPVQYLKGTSRRQPIVVGDLDGDDDIDIVVANNVANGASRYASIMINDGKGVFTERGRVNCPGGVGLAAVTDFDNDGKMDFVLSSSNKVLIVPGKGDGTFGTPSVYDLGHKVGPLQLHDLDGDGRLDFIYLDQEKHQVMMQLNIDH